MEVSLLPPEVFLCTEEAWADPAFQNDFTIHLFGVMDLIEKYGLKIWISEDYYCLLFGNAPWTKYYDQSLHKDKNFEEVFLSLCQRKLFLVVPDGGIRCRINPDIFIYNIEKEKEIWQTLTHAVKDIEGQKNVILGFTNQSESQEVEVLCECHPSQKYLIFRLNKYEAYLEEQRKQSLQLSDEEEQTIKGVFLDWRTGPDSRQNRILKQYALGFEHHKSGHGCIFSLENPHENFTVPCTPGSRDAGKEIARKLILLIERCRQSALK